MTVIHLILLIRDFFIFVFPKLVFRFFPPYLIRKTQSYKLKYNEKAWDISFSTTNTHIASPVRNERI